MSCQPQAGSALDVPETVAALARVAQDGGAVAVRVQGARNIAAARARVTIPIVGLVKRSYEGFGPYITPTPAEVREVAAAGAHIVAFDATPRMRPNGATLASVVAAVATEGAIAMADCATLDDARAAHALGVPIAATTLCGYTEQTAGTPLPALDLVRAFQELPVFRICEGGVHDPRQGRAALDAGADAVVVGTAITNVDWLVERFAAALRPA